jgi:hypothetical protein
MCFCVCVCCYVCECVFGFLCALSEARSQPRLAIARWGAEGSAGRNKCTARERLNAYHSALVNQYTILHMYIYVYFPMCV